MSTDAVTLEPEVARVAPRLAEPHYSPRFDFDEAALAIGVPLGVRLAEQFLADGE